jgi:hypothetical protein
MGCMTGALRLDTAPAQAQTRVVVQFPDCPQDTLGPLGTAAPDGLGERISLLPSTENHTEADRRTLADI